MDKVSKLLAEAKPLYIKKQKEKKAVLSMVLSLFLVVGVSFIANTSNTQQFDEAQFDNYITALYDSNVDFSSDDVVDSNVWFDIYSGYEVS